MIMPTDSRRAVVAPTRRERRGMEGAHGFPRLGDEGEMDRTRLVAGAEPEFRRAVGAEQTPAFALADDAHAERAKCGEIEGFAFREVGDGEADVIDGHVTLAACFQWREFSVAPPPNLPRRRGRKKERARSKALPRLRGRVGRGCRKL